MTFREELEKRREKISHLTRTLSEQGVRFAHVIYPDMTGALRIKIAPFPKAMSPEGETVNAVLGCMSHGDGEPTGDVCWLSKYSCEANGYPNIPALADPDSLVRLAWRPQTASFFINVFDSDGKPWAADLRAMLRRLEMELEELGYTAKFAVEYEFGLFHADESLMAQRRFGELRPYGPKVSNYDLCRAPGMEDLVDEFIDRMAGIGIGVASFMTEYGRGMYECALTPKSPLAAADDAVRAKEYLRQLCAERGLVPTFMTRFRPPGQESSAGAHIHQSLYRGEDNAFYDATAADGMTQCAREYLAGLLATVADFHVLYRPTMNAYRRMDRQVWSPEHSAWGYENRMCAVRFIDRPGPNQCRFEHRVPGADMNPYLAIGGMLAGGLHGLRQHLEATGGSTWGSEAAGCEKLPNSLAQSLARFRNSAVARDFLGAGLVEHYAASRDAEIAAFDQWLKSTITDFEWARYF